MAATSVPIGYSVTDEATAWDGVDDSQKGLWLVFAVGVTLVVLAVALVFDSVWAAAIVFFTLPFALGGVMGAFWLAHAAFTREAAVGVILAIGLAVNHSCLIADAGLNYRMRRRQEGEGRPRIFPADAYRAALDRSGMIMLVTVSTMASLVPLAVNTKLTDLFGAIALATAGGTVASTVSAMFIMPAMMTLRIGRPRWPRWPGRFLRRPRRRPAPVSVEATAG
jgi:multidrug efflux pump subunit AcrB